MKRRDFINVSGLGIYGTMASPLSSTVTAEQNNWQPDGSGFLGRFGLLTPDFDPVPESEMMAMSPPGISIHSSRVRYIRNNPNSFADAANIDEAVSLVSALNPKIILYGFTSTSYTLGTDAELQVIQRLTKISNGIPVHVTCKAAVTALNLIKAKKLALIHPPWFSNELNAQGRSYFESQGFEVVSCKAIAPARAFSEVKPEELSQWVEKNTPKAIDAIFIAGNGLRTAGAISRLEKKLDVPILAANQILLWSALRLIGETYKVSNYGSIFSKS